PRTAAPRGMFFVSCRRFLKQPLLHDRILVTSCRAGATPAEAAARLAYLELGQRPVLVARNPRAPAAMGQAVFAESAYQRREAFIDEPVLDFRAQLLCSGTGDRHKTSMAWIVTFRAFATEKVATTG